MSLKNPGEADLEEPDQAQAEDQEEQGEERVDPPQRRERDDRLAEHDADHREDADDAGAVGQREAGHLAVALLGLLREKRDRDRDQRVGARHREREEPAADRQQDQLQEALAFEVVPAVPAGWGVSVARFGALPGGRLGDHGPGSLAAGPVPAGSTSNEERQVGDLVGIADHRRARLPVEEHAQVDLARRERRERDLER